MSFHSSVFSGTAIVCNFVLMVTWTPSIFVFYQKFFASSTCSSMLPPHMKSPLKSTARESQTKEDDNKAIPSITNSSKHILRYFCSFNWIRLLSQKALSLLFWKNKLENWTELNKNLSACFGFAVVPSVIRLRTFTGPPKPSSAAFRQAKALITTKASSTKAVQNKTLHPTPSMATNAITLFTFLGEIKTIPQGLLGKHCPPNYSVSCIDSNS